ncbi:DUF2721 domain-containing protein [bacterium]|nr:MAG: DUF2721 domain-containing protein [bacterium]
MMRLMGRYPRLRIRSPALGRADPRGELIAPRTRRPMAVNPFGGHDALAGVVSQMITPAVLILASGSLVSSTLTRLARSVDRARVLLRQGQEARAGGDRAKQTRIERILVTQRRRVELSERALSAFYLAIGFFVACSLAIAIDALVDGRIAWVPGLLAILGGLVLLLGSGMQVLETNLATGGVQDAINEYHAGLDVE